MKDQKTGRWISSHVMNQDFIAWIGQGVIADRTKEHLSAGDQGIIMVRKRFLNDLKAIAEGTEPKAVIRNPEINRGITLPIADRKALTEGLSREELLKHRFLSKDIQGCPFQAGQPDEIRIAFAEAMGIHEP
jgi:5,5'-dehydrodivanillate O-demethylase